MPDLTDIQYREAVDLCRRVVDAADSDDGGPTVAGSVLGTLFALLMAHHATTGEGLRLTPGLHHGSPWRQGGAVPHHVYVQRGDQPDRRPWPAGDPPLVTFPEPADAQRAVEAVNAVRAGLCGETDVLRYQVQALTEANEQLDNDLGEQRTKLRASIALVTRDRDRLAIEVERVTDLLAETARNRDAIAHDRDQKLIEVERLAELLNEPVREEWVVFYGGPDPDNFAGRLEESDRASAEEMQRWIYGSGVAHRTLYAGPWHVTIPSRDADDD